MIEEATRTRAGCQTDPMRLSQVEIRDFRSVWGEPLRFLLGRTVTALVGPNQAGKSNLIRAIACALDPTIAYDPLEDLPSVSGKPSAEVQCTYREGDEDTGRLRVTWLGGNRVADVKPEDAALPVGPGRVVLASAGDDVGTIVTAILPVLEVLAGEPLRRVPGGLEAAVLAACSRVIPEVAEVHLEVDRGRATSRMLDGYGFLMRQDAGLRPAAAAGVARYLADQGVDLAAVLIEEPEAYLHPAAQEQLRDDLEQLAVDTGAAVIITSESPFMVPRTHDAYVLAVAKDPQGATGIVADAYGNEAQAPLLGGLFRDPGFADVIDRATKVPVGSRGVVIFEGGTDEAYLRLAAEKLGRAHELEHVAIQPAGGAMAAALQAIVLRAETELPLLVIFDNDDQGRRAKHTLVNRFQFDRRRQVTTYAELVPDYPEGVEAEDMFDWRFVQRFVDEQGPKSIRGKMLIHEDEWHFDLTSASKSAFVDWAQRHAQKRDLRRWGQVLDIISERLGLTSEDGGSVAPGPTDRDEDAAAS